MQFQLTGMYPQGVVLVVLSALCVFLNTWPLVWHLRHQNLAASCLLVWVILLNLRGFVNPIIWPNDGHVDGWKGYGYCDVQIRMLASASLALPTTLIALLRSLCQVMDTKNVTLVPTQRQRRINLAVNLFLCFGVPVLAILGHIVWQGGRYWVYMVSGCAVTSQNSLVTTFLYAIWPPIFMLVSAGYAALLTYRLRRYRNDFCQLLAISKTTKARFLRLYVMCFLTVLLLLPISLWNFITSMQRGEMYNGYDWDYLHSPEVYEVQMVPAFGIVPPQSWVYNVLGFITFFVFGLSKDAVDMYRNALIRLGFAKVFPSLTSTGSTGSSRGFPFGSGTWTSFNDRARGLFRRRKVFDSEKGSRFVTLKAWLTRSSGSSIDDSAKFTVITTTATTETLSPSTSSMASRDSQTFVTPSGGRCHFSSSAGDKEVAVQERKL